VFAAIATEAGLPDGALNIVTGLGEEAGVALSTHAGISLMTFTGSPEVGTLVQKAAADSLIKCVLELGGKSPQIVFEDADLERAVQSIGEELHGQYLISYSPDNKMEAGWHDIRVEVLDRTGRARRDLKLRWRPGYWMAARPQ